MSEYPMYRKRKTLNGVEYVKIVNEDRAIVLFIDTLTKYKGATTDYRVIAEMSGYSISNQREFNDIDKEVEIFTND